MLSPCLSLRRLFAAAGAAASIAAVSFAGGTPENAVVVVDPAFADSLHLANFYINLRNIPESNVLYMDSAAATNYQQWAAVQQPAFIDFLDARGIADHTDYVIVSPTDTFWVSEGGLVTDTCFDIQRFSLGSLYTMIFISSEILAGPTNQGKSNRYYLTTDSAIAFDSDTAYLSGLPNDANVNARRYYIGATLGWTGNKGNLLTQITSALSASAGADGTRPTGTFYFMNNTADAARNVRNNQFNAAVTAITSRGGQAQVIVGSLPTGKTDCLGIMTGVAGFSLFGQGITIKPGAFCDHLTSYAATYDIDSQTKTTEWVTFGAAGSSGTVEEPCNYTGKFPRAMLHGYYFQGLSLGESWFRSLQFIPFQQNFVGDPLARPFAYIPTVNVVDAPTGPVSGTITLTPTASTTGPGASIAALDLLVNGVVVQSITPGGQFTLDTMSLPDGFCDVRVLAYDNTAVKSVGRWTGAIQVDNRGRTTTLTRSPASGDRATNFTFNVAGTGGAVKEIRLLHNGRVVAAAQSASAALTVYGQILGAGTSNLRAETEYLDGRISRSEPVGVSIAASGTPVNTVPIAYSYRKDLTGVTNSPLTGVVELPATYDSAQTGPAYTYTVLTSPVQASALGTYGGAYRIYDPNVGASGQEDLTYRVTTPGGPSNIATVTLIYSRCAADYDGSGFVDTEDFDLFVANFEAGDSTTDFDNSGFVDTDDYDAFVQAFTIGC